MREEDLLIIRQCFALSPNINADELRLVDELIEEIVSLDEQLERAVAANRHYLHHFFNGKIDEMAKTFKYMMTEQ
ncbi:hypothetical protein [Bacillus sp. NTK034]|uniref:hypothetical protein n=1 Tax=Bacillus sp. NTK034 TaxID=2802176 RepID=UPI001A9018D9|nr:hypothetical protein [Bacillus sp. NTK034]MBN8200514.1 hypothetical protein [Bacillus sp. NTK034]